MRAAYLAWLLSQELKKGSMTMKILKRALSLFIVGLFIFTAFAVIQLGGNQAQVSPSASSSFTFPYQYGTPTVPSDVGVQGRSGSGNISLLGPQTVQGPNGHLGPVNITQAGSFTVVNSTVEVQVLNGTKNPAFSSPAVGDTVSLKNMTTGSTISATTNSNGYVNVSATEGWYVLHINQNKNTFINFTQEIDITTTHTFLTRYMMPVSNATTAINNGGSATVYLSPNSILWQQQGILMPQITISLYNQSGGNTFLGSVVTGSNGTAEFTGLNTAYSYYGYVDGYSQTATGVVYNMSNSNQNPFQPGAGTTHPSSSAMLASYNENTATVIGTGTFPVGASSGTEWGSTGVKEFKNGTVFFGSILAVPTGQNLSFVNDVVYFDGPDAGQSMGNISFQNSTIVFLTQSVMFTYFSHVSLIHTQVFGSVRGSAYGRNGFNFYNTVAKYSIFRYGTPPSIGVGWNGTYIDSLFEQSNISAASNPGTETGGVNFINDKFLNMTFGAYQYWNITNSIIEYSSMGSQISGESVVNNDTFILTSNTPWTSSSIIILSMSGGDISNSLFTYAYPYGVPQSTYWSDANEIVLDMGNIHFRSDIFNFGGVLHRTITISSSDVSFNNDYINTTYTLSQEISITSNTSSAIVNGNRFAIHQLGENLWMNNTTLDGVGNIQIATFTGNGSFNHDLFTGYLLGNAYSIFSLFSGVPTGYLSHIQFSNDTFGDVCYNSTVFYNLETKVYGPIGMEWLFDTNFNGQSKPVGALAFDYNTFLGMPFGPSSLFVSGGLLIGANGVTTYVNNTLFANSLSATHAPVSYENGTYYLAPYGADIAIGGGTNYITNNYFLNLNNETLPIIGSASTQGTGWNPTVKLDGNRFFYKPTPLESYVEPYGQYLPAQVTTAYHDHWLTGLPTQSTVTYEIPIDTNGTMTSTGPMLVSNISFQQVNVLSGGSAADGATPDVWSWSVAPDVNALSGTPTISYANGLVGGPQPNFIWKGYNYSESVEPTYIQVGVNSSKAPSIDLQFSGVPGIQYVVQIISHGSEIESFIENASSSGILNATYNPATMPLDPTFEVSPYVAPPPPYNPVQPNPPMNFFPAYIFYLLLATSAAGVAAGIYIMIRRR